MDKVDSKSCFMQLKSIWYTNAEKYSVFFGIFLMSGNDQYGRRLLLWGETAEIFGFTFNMQMPDALSSVYEISMADTAQSGLKTLYVIGALNTSTKLLSRRSAI